MTSRERALLLLVLFALLATTLWSASSLASARSGAQSARARAAEAEGLASQILSLRTQPASAGSTDFPPGELSRRITQAAIAAAIGDGADGVGAGGGASGGGGGGGGGGGAVERIDPESPRRIGETPYRETPTSVRLRKISLKQLLLFLHAAESDGALRATSLRLTAPRGGGSGGGGGEDKSAATDLWTAELTLSHLTYSPR